MPSGYYRTRRDEPQSDLGYYRYGPSTRAATKVVTSYPLGTHEVWSFRSNEPADSLDTPQKAIFDANRVDLFRSPIDTGHPFWVQHDTCTPPQAVVLTNSNQSVGFWGKLYASPAPGSLPLSRYNPTTGKGTANFQPHPTKGELEAFGASAIAATIPTAPNANVATALAELLVDLPKVPLAAANKILTLKDLRQQAGSEVLNQVFGWLPLIKDIQLYCKAVVESARILGRFHEESSLAVRQWHRNPITEVKSSVSADAFHGKPSPNVALNWAGTTARNILLPGSARSYTHQISTIGWKFSGAYSYVAIEGSTFYDKIRRFEQDANVLLGTRITPEVLWELAPWSWLVDWWAEIGKFISINSRLAQDGLVLQFGYLTAFSHQRTLCSTEASDQYGRRVSINTLYESKRRERVRATPYGFGVNTSGLTANQVAILAALGFSR